MNITKVLFGFFAATALFWAVACEKQGPEGDNADPAPGPVTEITDINGTAIQEGNNLVGLVSDSKTGKGIANVVVSDGYSVVKTDVNGVYQFKASRYAKTVFVSLPSEYEVPLDAKKRPAYYRAGINQKKVNRYDFTLTPLAAIEDSFTFIAIGDPQCTNAKEVGRYTNETINDIAQTLSSNQNQGKYMNAYAMTLGDNVNDTPDMWEKLMASMEKVQIGAGKYLPIFITIGNHDHNAKESSDMTAVGNFQKYCGPTDYSFNRGKVHIVSMDNVVCTETNNKSWDYDAGFSKMQYEWLKADLAAVENKAEKMLIICCHIPFRNGATSGGATMNKDKYYEEVLALMRDFNEAHIMIGHTHYIQNYIHTRFKTKNGNPVYEHIHGGACGGWWSSNICVTGAPNGYGIYEIEGAHIKNWLAKSTGFPESHQMRVYDGNQTWSGSKGYTYNWYQNSTGGSSAIKYTGRSFLKDAIVVSLWNDDDKNWKVEFTHNGKTTPMTRATSTVMDAAAVSYFFNECGKNTTSWTKGMYSYWYLPVDVDPSTLTGWTVTATQTIPGSDVKNVYTCGSFQTDYTGF